MAQVGPGPLPLFDELDLVSDAVLCTLLLSGNRLVVHRTHPQPDSLWQLPSCFQRESGCGCVRCTTSLFPLRRRVHSTASDTRSSSSNRGSGPGPTCAMWSVGRMNRSLP